MTQFFNRRMQRRSEPERGFTLIELLVVIVILGILAAVVVFAVGGTGDKGKAAAFSTDAETVRTAQEAYCARNGTYGTEAELVSGGFLSEESSTWDVELGAGGNCGATTGQKSGFGLQCQVATGCGPTGGTMVVAITSAPTATLNPATNSNGGEHTNSEAMFNGLLAWSSNNAAVPDLAQSYTISPDLKTATFTLKPGMKWHNGTPITAADVEFSYEQSLLRYHSRTAASMGPALNPPVAPAADPDNAVVNPNAITTDTTGGTEKVTFNFAFGYVPLLRQLNVTEGAIIPKDVYEACAPSTLGAAATLNETAGTDADGLCLRNQERTAVENGLGYDTPVGSGPFKIDPANTDVTKITVVKNSDYKAIHMGLPYLDKVVYPLVTAADVDLALNAPRGQAGSVDIGSPVPTDAPPFFTKDGYGFSQTPRGTGGGNCILTVAFNLWPEDMAAATIGGKAADAYEHFAFKNLAVREAVSKAINRTATFDNIEKRIGRQADSPYHSSLNSAYTATGVPGFDPAAARAQLEATGWKDPTPAVPDNDVRVADGVPGVTNGTTLDGIDLTHFNTFPQTDYAAEIISNLDQVGIGVVDKPGTAPVVRGFLTNRDYDMAIISYCHGDDPVIGLRRQYHSDQITANAFVNVAGYKSTQMDTLWNQAISATGANYTSAHNQIQAKARADLPYVWVNETIVIRAYRSVCKNFNFANTGLFVETAYCSP